jgi:hypothetical protein
MITWKRWFRIGLELAAVALLPLAAGCTGNSAPVGPRSSMFIGIDVSGSFQKSGRYDDALAFAAYYIHAHLTGAGTLEQPKNLFVGSIGGEHPGQPQAFHPIEDFQGKSIGRIVEDLREWFPANEPLTDFNAFFKRTATEVKRRGLVLAPITVVILSDGIPDLGRKHGNATAAYQQIDMKPLEYLARRVTVRLLYADPEVAAHWEHDVPRDRVRLWTVDNVVMAGWHEQLMDTVGEGAAVSTVSTATAASEGPRREMAAGGAGSAVSAHDTAVAADSAALASLALAMRPGSEADNFLDSMAAETPAAPVYPPGSPALWRWIRDNVDFRVRERVL